MSFVESIMQPNRSNAIKSDAHSYITYDRIVACTAHMLLSMFENTYFTFFFQISKKHDFLRFLTGYLNKKAQLTQRERATAVHA